MELNSVAAMKGDEYLRGNVNNEAFEVHASNEDNSNSYCVFFE